MQRILLMMLALLISILIGCNNNAEQQIDTNTNETMHEETNDNDGDNNNIDNNPMNPEQDKIISQMERLDFTEFDLEVSYDNDVEYEAELKRKENGHYKVQLEDEINGLKLNGTEAFEKIYPIIKDLPITKDSNKDDVIQNVLNVFDLATDYQKFELEIHFNDGTKIEYEEKR